MPRYDDDRHGSARLYVGHLSSRTRTRDVERLFSKYGRIRDLDMKRDFAFVEFSDPRDADDARYRLDGRDIDGSRIVVEFAKGMPRGSGSGYGSREITSSRGGGGGGGPPPGAGRCFNCGVDGHWARDCTAGDWKNKCYRCGDRGHIERNCKNSPKKLKRDQSHSRSPVRSRSRSPPRRRRNRSRSRSRSGSYSRSRSPVRAEKEQSVERAARSGSMEPTVDNVSPPLKDNSVSPNEASPMVEEKNVESLKDQSNGDATNGQDHSPIDEPSP